MSEKKKILTVIPVNNSAYDESIKVLPVKEDFIGDFLDLVYSVRSKVTLEVHIDPEYSSGKPEIEDIYTNPLKCLQTCTSVDDFNKQLSKSDLLKNVLGYKHLSCDAELSNYTSSIFNSLKGADNLGRIKTILSTVGIEDYISRITVKVGPNAAFKDSIKDNVFFRFVKYTMMELFAMNNFSLSLAGLFEADGIILLGSLASDKNIFLNRSVYDSSDIFKAFKSTQLFYVQSSANLIEHIENNNYQDLFISNFKNGGLSNYSFSTYFNRTFDSLVSMRVLNYDKERGYYSEYPFFKQTSISYILPVSGSLVNYLIPWNEFSMSELLKSKDFQILTQLNTRVLTDILRKIDKLETTIDAITQEDGIAKELFMQSYKKHESYLKNDSRNFGLGNNVCKCVQPQFEYMTSIDLLKLFKDIQSPDAPILGEKGGITTRKNNKYKYPATVISATSGYLWIEYIIDHIEVSSDLRTKTGDLVFEEYEGDLEMQTFLIRYLLKRILWKCFIGYERINGLLIIDKYITKQAIEMYRNDSYDDVKENPFAAVMNKIVYLFAESLSNNDR